MQEIFLREIGFELFLHRLWPVNMNSLGAHSFFSMMEKISRGEIGSMTMKKFNIQLAEIWPSRVPFLLKLLVSIQSYLLPKMMILRGHYENKEL